MKKAHWLGPVPTTCDTCGNDLESRFYDAKTNLGRWACMCQRCFTSGPGLGKLGTGHGQEYTNQDSVWVKTGG